MTEEMIEAGWSAWISADNNGQDEYSCFVAGLSAAITAMQQAQPLHADEVERVARAICEAQGLNPDAKLSHPVVEFDGNPQWTACKKQARAAINAMQGIAIATPDTDRVAVLIEAASELAEVIKTNKIAFVHGMPRRDLGFLMDALHKVNAALSQPLGSKE